MPNLAYDPTTTLGQVRFFAADTDVADDTAVFTDAELNMCLTLAMSNPMLAAATALEAKAVDLAGRAEMVKVGPITVDSRDMAKTLSERAAALRSQSSLAYTTTQFAAAGTTPDRIFSTDSDEGVTEGTMTGW